MIYYIIGRIVVLVSYLIVGYALVTLNIARNGGDHAVRVLDMLHDYYGGSTKRDAVHFPVAAIRRAYGHIDRSRINWWVWPLAQFALKKVRRQLWTIYCKKY